MGPVLGSPVLGQRHLQGQGPHSHASQESGALPSQAHTPYPATARCQRGREAGREGEVPWTES